MHEMFKVPSTTAQILMTTIVAFSLLACGSSHSTGNARQDAASADVLDTTDSSKVPDGTPASTVLDTAADLPADHSAETAKIDGSQGDDIPAKAYDAGGETGIVLDATGSGDSASGLDAPSAIDSVATSDTRDSAVNPHDGGPTSPDLTAKTDLSEVPSGTHIEPNRVMHLAASDFPYHAFVNNWDDAKYPVFYALIQSSADFGTYLNPMATMGSSVFTPTDKEFSEYSYVLIARVVDDSSQPASFAVDALIASGTELNVLYKFLGAKVPGTSTKKDGLLIELPRRSPSKVTLYENQMMLGSLDIANGKKDVTVN